jgi:hypothetical protein
MDWAHETTRTIDLGYEQLLTFVGRPGTRVRVLFGSMWLTEEGREQDIFAHCGDELTLRSGGLSVIEGLGAARVQLIDPKPHARWALIAKGVRRAWTGLRARQGARELLARFVILLLAIAVSVGVLHIAAPGPLAFKAAVTASAATNAQRPVGVAAAVLNDVASARTGFLAVN